MQVVGGDPAVAVLRGGSAEAPPPTPAELDRVHHQLGLDRPLIVQYADFAFSMLRLEPGSSLFSGLPISQEYGQRLPVTLELGVLGLLIAWFLGVPAGVIGALRPDSWIDNVLRVVSVGGLSIPQFWFGALAILAFSLWFGWAPPLGYTSPTIDLARNLQQFLIPAVVLGFSASAGISRITRSAMLEVLYDDYVRTARAKGLPPVHVVVRHAFKNALLPVVTLAGLQVERVIGGAVILENVFALPGLGRYLVDGITHSDLPVVESMTLLFAATFLVANLAVDVLYAWIDPRIRYS
jgi:peptide/nickel transport system permease protein